MATQECAAIAGADLFKKYPGGRHREMGRIFFYQLPVDSHADYRCICPIYLDPEKVREVGDRIVAGETLGHLTLDVEWRVTRALSR